MTQTPYADKTAMVLDDALMSRTVLRDLLENIGFAVVLEARDGHEAIEVCAGKKPDLLLLDLNIPGPKGADLIERIAEVSPRTRIILVTGLPTDLAQVQEAAARASMVLSKPVKYEALEQAVAKVLGLEAGQ